MSNPTGKMWQRMKRAAALREFTVILVPYNGGNSITVKGVTSYTPELAMRKAAEDYPGYMGRSARVTKVLDNPPKEKWLPVSAIKFNKNGSVSLKKR